MRKKAFFRSGIINSLFLGVSICIAHGEELPEGFTIDKSNVNSVMDKTLDGHKIKDLILDSHLLLVNNYGFTIKAGKYKPIHPITGLPELTQKFSGQAKLDEKNRLINYTAGMPFDKIEMSDPQAGIKLAHNYTRGPFFGDTMWIPHMYTLSIDMKNGVQREMIMDVRQFIAQGRLTEPYKVDDKITNLQSLAFVAPNDLRGVGLLTIKYVDARLPDVYAYIKPVRRVRRLSSGAWADPVSATDMLNDESFALNADPSWYKSWKLLGTRHILAVAHGEFPTYNINGKTREERYKAVDLTKPPYISFKLTHEPREVWVVEGIPPVTHMASKKIFYMEKNINSPFIYWEETFDRSGKLWRVINECYTPIKAQDGRMASSSILPMIIDIQRGHATLIAADEEYLINPKMSMSEFTPEALQKLAN